MSVRQKTYTAYCPTANVSYIGGPTRQNLLSTKFPHNETLLRWFVFTAEDNATKYPLEKTPITVVCSEQKAAGSDFAHVRQLDQSFYLTRVENHFLAFIFITFKLLFFSSQCNFTMWFN